MTTTIQAAPYTAQQCPECGVWVYVADGPFAEDDDPTKPLADWLHWRDEHLNGNPVDAVVIGFPFFNYNDKTVLAVKEGRTE